MLSFKRLKSCAAYALSYIVRAVSVSVGLPVRLFLAIATYFGVGMISGSEKPDNVGTNDNFKTMDSHESDSDDESFTCEYDSTWEEEDVYPSVDRKTKKKKSIWSWSTSRRNTNAAKDMQTYRHDYPDEQDPPPCQIFPQNPNLKFYKNEMKSQPDNVSIVDFHEKWWGEYDRLERVHTFIQWLFPIREDGVNFQAYKLTKDEIKAFKADESAKEKLIDSYELMLDFYGIKLVDRKTGEVERANNYEKRFENLNKHTHNNLRITRILKCLGTLGFTHYQAPLVRFFLKETLENGQLRNVRRSVLDYFLFSVLDKNQRKELIKEAFVMFQKSQGDGHNGEKFVWCPKWVQKKFQEELSRNHTGTNNGKNHNLCSVDETQKYKLKLKEEEGSRAQNMGIHEEPKSEQTGTNTTSQNFDSVDETQDNKSELEEVEGSNGQNDKDGQTANEKPIFGANLHSEPLDSKHSDEHEISGSKGDDAKHINAEVAGDGVEEQHDITDHQQSAHKPTVMATDDSSITESPTKPLQSVSHNQQCSNQVDLTAMKDDTSPELTSVPQDELEGRLSLAQEDGPIGGPAIPPQKAETIEETLKQGNDDDTKANLGDLPEENSSSVLENRDVPEDAPESTGFEV